MGALEDAISMTHWPEQPNPAEPYLKAAKDFAKGGISEVIGHHDPLGDLLQSDAANTAIGMAMPLKGIKAYHGSPHDFEKFDLGKIGTGEGAQAYGVGLYFAENEKVAADYRNKLTAYQQAANDPISKAKFLANANGLDNAIGHFEKVISQGEKYPKLYDAATVENARQSLGYLQSGGDTTLNPGRMYQVSINADPEHFLDWDRPLNQQDQTTRDAANAIAAIHPRLKETVENPYSTAESLVSAITHQITGDHAKTSEMLRQAGIPGIKYLDQGSRASGEGSRNYVVFDDKTIDILKKYGLAGLGLGGAAAQSSDPLGNGPLSVNDPLSK